MKYSNTPRVLNLVFHSIIFLAFGCLGIYFSFFVTPFYCSANPTMFSQGVPNGFNLYAILGATGLTLMAISGLGIRTALKSLKNPVDDSLVEKGFTAFIAEGGFASVFFIAFATTFFELAAPNHGNITFVIIMSVILSLVFLIATNIPMVKLYDGKDQSLLVSSFVGTGGLFFGFVSLQAFIAYIVAKSRGVYSFYPQFNGMLFTIFIVTLVIALLALGAAFLLLKKKKSQKDSDKVIKLSGYLTAASMFVTAALAIGFGVFFIMIGDTMDIHLNYFSGMYQGPTFPIMLIVMGSLILVSSVAVAFVNFKEITDIKPKKHNN